MGTKRLGGMVRGWGFVGFRKARLRSEPVSILRVFTALSKNRFTSCSTRCQHTSGGCRDSNSRSLSTSSPASSSVIRLGRPLHSCWVLDPCQLSGFYRNRGCSRCHRSRLVTLAGDSRWRSGIFHRPRTNSGVDRPLWSYGSRLLFRCDVHIFRRPGGSRSHSGNHYHGRRGHDLSWFDVQRQE